MLYNKACYFVLSAPGFDTHFSAYGVDAVLLWNGYDNVDWPSSGSLDEVYLGANNPSVSFDNSHARFTVSQLHTAREQINTTLVW